MNKVIIMGRCARDVEVRYSANGNAVARGTLAVDRYVKDGDNTADFISIVAFGKRAEFLEKYGKKGTKLLMEGNIKTGSYEKEGKKVYTTDVIIEQIEFAESKAQATGFDAINADIETDGFMDIPDNIDSELPFN